MTILTKGYSIGSQVYGGIETLGNLYEQFFAVKDELGRRGKLDEFVSSTNSKDFARSAHFRFRILPGGAKLNSTGKFNETFSMADLSEINMLCDSTTLPDVASIPISASVATDFPYEITKDFAYATQSATFYVSEDMFQKKFFDDWMDLTYHKSAGQAHYYDDYSTTMEIYQLKRTLDNKNLNTENDWTYKTTLYGVYPKSVAPMTLDWSSANALQKVSVTFHYTHWDSKINSK